MPKNHFRTLLINDDQGWILTQDKRRGKRPLVGWPRNPNILYSKDSELSYAKMMGCSIIVRIKHRHVLA